MITMEELREALEPARRITRRTLTNSDWSVYLEILNSKEGLRKADVERAVGLHLRESTFFPSPAELLRNLPTSKALPQDLKMDPLVAWESIRTVWFRRIQVLQGGHCGVSERELYPLVKREFRQKYPSLQIPCSAYTGVDDVEAGVRRTDGAPFTYDHAPPPRWADVDGFNRWCQLQAATRHELSPDQERFEAIWRGTIKALEEQGLTRKVPARSPALEIPDVLDTGESAGSDGAGSGAAAAGGAEASWPDIQDSMPGDSTGWDR